MKKKYSFTKDNATEIIRQEVGQIFSQVLADAGVLNVMNKVKNLHALHSTL